MCVERERKIEKGWSGWRRRGVKKLVSVSCLMWNTAATNVILDPTQTL